MSDLSEFLLARIAEDEALAWAASPGHWRADGGEVWTDSRTSTVVVKFTWPQEARHIARHDSARVLAECEAKRRIVEAWQAADRAAGGYPGTDAGIVQGLEEAMVYLALPYADHIDYREEWKP